MKMLQKQIYKHNREVLMFCVCLLVFVLLTRRLQSPLVLHYGIYSAVKSNAKYLSYQPGGQGWNNQRIVLEHAVIFAKLLNRTLIVHPVSEHPLGQDMVGRLKIQGYEAYNLMNKSNLLPLSRIVDLYHLSFLVPVLENAKPHSEFNREYSHLTRHDVCHSVAYGFWVDRRAQTEREGSIIENQFFREKKDILNKCGKSKFNLSSPIIRYIFPDLLSEPADILYFSEATLFAIDVRFFDQDLARTTQQWITHYIRYHPEIISAVDTFTSKLPTNSCCLHARRTGYHRPYQTWQHFLWLTSHLGCQRGSVLYLATDLLDHEFTNHFLDYKLLNATSLTPYVNFRDIPLPFYQALLGIHEQLVCVKSSVFAPSNYSTMSYYVMRARGEVPQRDGMMLKHFYFYFIEHYVDKIISKFYVKS